MFKILFIFIFLLPHFCNLSAHFLSNKELDENVFVEKGSPRTSVDDPEVFKRIKPYLLPQYSQVTKVLDLIFSKKDVLFSIKTLENAGFQMVCNRRGGRLFVASHPFLKGLLVKVYLDDLKHSEWTRWERRIKGAQHVQKAIDENKRYKKYFKVPKKWIYILPKESRGSGDFPRESILLVEDMQIVDKEISRSLYRVLWNYEGLDALYTVLQKSGFSDGHVDNLPFSVDERVAFIDTEYTNQPNVHFDWLTKFFANSKQSYWQALIDQGGPKS